VWEILIKSMRRKYYSTNFIEIGKILFQIENNYAAQDSGVATPKTMTVRLSYCF
jgi:hypothetical protein